MFSVIWLVIFVPEPNHESSIVLPMLIGESGGVRGPRHSGQAELEGNFLMKTQMLIIAGAFLLFELSIVTLHAQELQARIPFNFIVSSKTFPAGEYRMELAPHEVTIHRADDGRAVAIVLADEISGRHIGTPGEITFHCYGDRCFLTELWSSGRGNGLRIFISKAETRLRKRENGQYYAVLGEAPLQ